MNMSNLGFCYALEDAQGPRIAPCTNVVDSECLLVSCQCGILSVRICGVRHIVRRVVSAGQHGITFTLNKVEQSI